MPGDLGSRNPITGIADSCAFAASGQVAAAPPSSVMNSRLFTRSPRRRWKAPLRAPRSLVFYPGSSPFDATCKVAVTRRLRRTDLSGRRQMLAPLRAGGSCCFCGRKATPVKIRQLVSLPPARRDTVRLGRQVADRSKKRPRLLPPKHGAIREPRGGERGNPVALSSYAPRGKGRRPHMPRSYLIFGDIEGKLDVLRDCGPFSKNS